MDNNSIIKIEYGCKFELFNRISDSLLKNRLIGQIWTFFQQNFVFFRQNLA